MTVNADFILHIQTKSTARFTEVTLIYLKESKCM